MKNKDAAAAIRAKMDKSVEAPVYPDQRNIEMKLLAALAAVINSDLSDLKYDLLNMAASDFHFKDHRAIFAAIKALADAGEHIDRVIVAAELKDAWPDALKAVFDASNADINAADTYKRTVIFRANQIQARQVGLDYLAAVEAAAKDDLPGLVADLQKTVFDIAKTDHLSPPLQSEADLIDGFVLDLASPKPGYRTGFDKLDKVIRGLSPGLFVIAAPPSAGKTTYVKQLADQVAENNEAPVLFFSFEQSAAELRIKSLARLMNNAGKFWTNEDIKEGKAKREDIDAGAAAYRRFAQWITIIEGDSRNNVGDIRLKAQREKIRTGKAPVIIIDYLQILPVTDRAMKDKRSEVDFLVSELRRIARDIEAPVIAISSMSRAEYKKASMSGFKESGGIEYGTDIAAILTVESENKDGQDAGTIRTVALNIIKNRNGRRGKIGMSYHMATDTFAETDFNHLSYMDALGVDTDED